MTVPSRSPSPWRSFLTSKLRSPASTRRSSNRCWRRGAGPPCSATLGIIYDNYCHLSLSGFTGAGFGITTGVRQGCPLSPLIFAIVSDVLIRRVRRLLPAVLIRAYADDIALMLGRGPLDCGLLEVIFAEYAHVSCLRLHHGKSIIVPLSLAPHDQVRAAVASAAATWGAFTVAGHAKYLGFYLGPTRGSLIWDTVFAKMQERASVWRKIGGGMLVSVAAYRMYILPLAGFLAQLEDLPPRWKPVEQSLMVTLFPGARGWATPQLAAALEGPGLRGRGAGHVRQGARRQVQGLSLGRHCQRRLAALSSATATYADGRRHAPP